MTDDYEVVYRNLLEARRTAEPPRPTATAGRG
jgi:hypothetical protein